MLCALDRLLQLWLERPASQRTNPEITPLFVEAVSDWTEFGQNGVIACQVKRTATSSTLRSALGEFWEIYKLTRSLTTHLKDRLEFRFIAKRAQGPFPAQTIDEWTPPENKLTASELGSFKSRISYQVEPDPEVRILATLANTFSAENPLGNLRAWLGGLFHACESGAALDVALAQIWSDLRSLEESARKRKPVGYVWTARDRPPDQVINGHVLTGRRPEVRDLRNGCFANREAIYRPLADEAEAWLETAGGEVVTMPFFWIGGRSGTGKSVALLHVLTALFERGYELILWLGNNPKLLPQAIRWSRPLLEGGDRVLFALDDLYSPNVEDDMKEVLDEVSVELAMLQQDDGLGIPAVLCCGPSDQRFRFEEHFPETVTVTHRDLPRETREELEDLWVWFCKRTGSSHDLPYAGGEDVLLVQLFFEWRTGQTLPEFAHRFRERVRGMDVASKGRLESLLNRMLALNRLYVDYPARAVEERRKDPDFEEGFRLLERGEHHLQIVATAGLGSLRLTHPHLANAIYDAWYEPGRHEPHRRKHLGDGIWDTFNYGEEPQERTAPLWAVARLGQKGADPRLQLRVERETVAILLPELYQRFILRHEGSLPTWLIPVWVELEARFPDVQLEPSPFSEGSQRIATADAPETGLRLLCHKLLQHSSASTTTSSETAMSGIRRFLSERREWSEWGPVALDYLIHTRQPDLLSEVADWVLPRFRYPIASRLLTAALGRGSRNAEKLVSCSLHWLRQTNWSHPGWPRVWSSLQLLLPENRELMEQGVSWLYQARPDNPSLGWVWNGVFEARPNDNALIDWGLRWLNKGVPGHPAWPDIWPKVQEARPDNEAIIEQAVRWLDETDPNHPAWGYAWSKLVGARPKNEALIERGLTWLHKTGPDHPSLGYVWEKVFEARPNDSALIDWAVRWLDKAAPGHPAWSDIWPEVQKAQPQNRTVIEQGLRWLNETDPNDPSWGYIWAKIQEARPHNEALIEQGLRWLATVRYIVNDVEAAIGFYTGLLGFELKQKFGPAIAILAKDDLELWVAGPPSSAQRPMPDPSQPAPGGWNRFVVRVEDIAATVAALTEAGANFRNEIISGPGGRQILVEDPSGNAIEVFQPS